MRSTPARSVRLLASSGLVALVAAMTAGCQTTQSPAPNGALPLAAADRAESDWRHDLAIYGPQYRADPKNVDVALRYAQALRATDQRAQAVAVLERASMEEPHNKAVLGVYGRALAEQGDYEQALAVLERAHSPDQPDWRILSAQGAVLDQLGRHADAQRIYLTALKIVPDEPSVLSNLGLSYALSKDLKNAEETLRRAAAQRSPDPRVRQNLALVVGLQGRLPEAESIASADLPPEAAVTNVTNLRHMLAHRDEAPKRKPETATARHTEPSSRHDANPPRRDADARSADTGTVAR